MSNSNLIQDLNLIFRDVLDNPEIALSETTVAADIPEWDSLNHVALVVAIERHFKVRFTLAQIQNWTNVGSICRDVELLKTRK